jgi:transcriptional regulator with XRE-family HTH domain
MYYIYSMDNLKIFISAKQKLGLSSRDMAAELGINERTISDYLNGVRQPSSRTMKRVEDLLAQREIVDAVRSEKEAHLLYLYRNLPPADQSTVDSITEALHAKLAAGTTPQK